MITPKQNIQLGSRHNIQPTSDKSTITQICTKSKPHTGATQIFTGATSIEVSTKEAKLTKEQNKLIIEEKILIIQLCQRNKVWPIKLPFKSMFHDQNMYIKQISLFILVQPV